MNKVTNETVINLPRSNIARCVIYEHDSRFYIRANKPNTAAFTPYFFGGKEYSEVIKIGNHWFKK